MMDKEFLADQVVEVLTHAGFKVSSRCYLRPRSFDLAARKGDLLLLLKILSNIDGLNERTALEIRRLANYLIGTPLLVGEKTRDQYLERGAVYFRYDIPTLSLPTLADCLMENALPLVYAAHGGLYVCIDGPKIRNLRLKLGISLGGLASELGVSRRTVSKYETESMDTSIDVALKLEEIFQEELIIPVDPFQHERLEEGIEKITNNILLRLFDIGFQVFPTAQAPFNAIMRDDNLVVLTSVSRYNDSMLKKARLMSSLSAVAKAQSAVIVDGESRVKRVDDTAIIELSELDRIDEPAEFEDLVEDRQNRSS